MALWHASKQSSMNSTHLCLSCHGSMQYTPERLYTQIPPVCTIPEAADIRDCKRRPSYTTRMLLLAPVFRPVKHQEPCQAPPASLPAARENIACGLYMAAVDVYAIKLWGMVRASPPHREDWSLVHCSYAWKTKLRQNLQEKLCIGRRHAHKGA
jgi:hypothetical protein